MGKMGLRAAIGAFIAVTAVLVTSAPALATDVPSQYRSCDAFLNAGGHVMQGKFEATPDAKIASSYNGTYTPPSTHPAGINASWTHNAAPSVEIKNGTGSGGTAGFDFTATLPVDAVIVVSGGEGKATTFDVLHSATGPSWSGHVDGPSGKDKIDYILVCTLKRLRVEKTASASFKRTHTWTIKKYVNDDDEGVTLEIPQGGSETVTWKVVVTEGPSQDSDFGVSGTIKVLNTNFENVSNAVLTESLSNATFGGDCTGTNGTSAPFAIAVGQTKTCTYSASLASGTNGTNTVTASSAGNSYLTTSASAGYTFGSPTSEIDESSTWNDTPNGKSGAGAGTTTYDEKIECGEEGHKTNVATVYGNDTGKLDDDDATVTWTCKVTKGDLLVEKTAETSFTKVNHWKVTKDVTPTSSNSGSANLTWSVDLDKLDPTYQDFLISGTIKVTNPAGNPTVGITVQDPGAVVTCPDLELSPGESVTCTYVIDRGDTPPNPLEGDNVVTVTTGDQGISGEDSAHWVFEYPDNPTLELYKIVAVIDSNGNAWTNGGDGFTSGWETPETYPQKVGCGTFPNLAEVREFTPGGEGGGTIGDVSLGSDDATATVTGCGGSNGGGGSTGGGGGVDIVVGKTAVKSALVLGENATFNIVVTNNGPDAAFGITLTDTMPEGMTFVSATPSAGTCAAPVGATFTCNLGNLLNGGKITIQMVGTPTKEGSYTNNVEASVPNETGPKPNTASATVTVTAPLTPPAVKPPVTKPAVKPPAPLICVRLALAPKMLTVGKKGTLVVTTVAGKKPKVGVRVSITGAGVAKVVRTSKGGKMIVSVKPSKAGIVKARIIGQKACNTQRIGVVGTFEPPVTG